MQRDFVSTDTVLVWVKLRFGKKKKPQIGNCWVYFYRQRKKFSCIFYL